MKRLTLWNRNALGDIWFDAGSRLRISSDLGLEGPFVLWIRWGWRAEFQCGIRKHGFPFVFFHRYR